MGKSFSVQPEFTWDYGRVNVALVALPKGREFKAGIPICLPSKGYDILGFLGQIGGTGIKYYLEGGEDPCITNEIGESKFQSCTRGCIKGVPPQQEKHNCKEQFIVARNSIGDKNCH